MEFGGGGVRASVEEFSPGRALAAIRELRRSGETTPILLLAPKESALSVAAMLEAGADDVIGPNTTPRETLIRVWRLAARGLAAPLATIRAGALTLDSTTRSVRCGDTELRLTATQFDVLARLAREPQGVVTEDAIRQEALGTTAHIPTSAVRFHVAKLRRKLRDVRANVRIESVPPRGYRLVGTDDAAPPAPTSTAHRMKL